MTSTVIKSQVDLLPRLIIEGNANFPLEVVKTEMDAAPVGSVLQAQSPWPGSGQCASCRHTQTFSRREWHRATVRAGPCSPFRPYSRGSHSPPLSAPGTITAGQGTPLGPAGSDVWPLHPVR